MKKNKFLLFAAIAMAVLTSCGGGQKGLPTSNEYPVVTIGPANAQLKTLPLSKAYRTWKYVRKSRVSSPSSMSMRARR